MTVQRIKLVFLLLLLPGLLSAVLWQPAIRLMEDVELAERIRDERVSFCRRLPLEQDEEWQQVEASALCRGELARIASEDLILTLNWGFGVQNRSERKETRQFLSNVLDILSGLYRARLEIAQDRSDAKTLQEGTERFKEGLEQMRRELEKLRQSEQRALLPPPSPGGGGFFILCGMGDASLSHSLETPRFSNARLRLAAFRSGETSVSPTPLPRSILGAK